MILKVIYGSEMNFLVCNVERYVVLSFFLIIFIGVLVASNYLGNGWVWEINMG